MAPSYATLPSHQNGKITSITNRTQWGFLVMKIRLLLGKFNYSIWPTKVITIISVFGEITSD